MKTATITWTSYNNYGTLLQAYALQNEIEKLGNENVILSDREVLKERKASRTGVKKTTLSVPQALTKRERLSRLVVNPGRLSRVLLARLDRKKYEWPYDASQEACERFVRDELKILEGETSDTLAELNSRFDAFLCGSDQIWSVFECNFNPYYFLNFAKKKKIAYAPSLGTDQIPSETVQIIKNLLSDFTAISVREKISADHLSELTGRDVEWVADPTLLHDRQFWSEFTAGIPARKKKYLLCYFLENKAWYFEYARRLAKQLHLKIVLIPNKWDFISSEYVVRTGVGPKEFVSLIQHAEYVLTDSYHGSIFSIIFQRSFQYLLRFENDDPKSQNIRIQSLFDYLGLSDRIALENVPFSAPIWIDYPIIDEKIAEFREKSRNYLECSLNGRLFLQ